MYLIYIFLFINLDTYTIKKIHFSTLNYIAYRDAHFFSYQTVIFQTMFLIYFMIKFEYYIIKVFSLHCNKLKNYELNISTYKASTFLTCFTQYILHHFQIWQVYLLGIFSQSVSETLIILRSDFKLHNEEII